MNIVTHRRISYKLKDDAFRCKRVLDKIGEILKDDEMSTTLSITNAENDDISMLDTLFKLSTFANVRDAAEKFIVKLKNAGYQMASSNDVNPDVIDTDTEKSILSIDTNSNQDSDSSSAIRDFNPLTVMIRIRYLPLHITKVCVIFAMEIINCNY